ncbi:MAG TPA: hypothetical protein DEO62_03130 [Lachnospiraceae bacterium]|nr:hypothetical protein [Lachnospiraceae bacterium]HBR04544.1 hypothetical protein [Lachnospiraceae bacterium]HBZ89998.1 hypothetical protein [Lachnospiraceae bacterium]
MVSVNNIHSITIDSKNHLFLSGDSVAIDFIDDNLYKPIEDYMDEDDRKEFLDSIEKKTKDWFYVAIRTSTARKKYALRITDINNSYIKFEMVSLDDMMGKNIRQIDEIINLRAMLKMSMGVYFVYDPSDESVVFYNAEGTFYESGNFTFDELQRAMKEKTTKSKGAEIDAFVNNVKSRNGHFSIAIDDNLINSEKTITTTIIEGMTIYHGEREIIVCSLQTEEVIGKKYNRGLLNDALTGLLNKAEITRIAMEKTSMPDGGRIALAIIDIDFFKHVNDTFGHQFGDKVIKRIASIISDEIGNKGVVGRFGGDEFVVVIDDYKAEDDLRYIFRNIKNLVSATFPGVGYPDNSPLSVSIGSAEYPANADNYNDLFTVADYCLYLAKAKGRNRYIIYTPSKHAPLEAILNQNMNASAMKDRESIEPGEVIIEMLDSVSRIRKPELSNLLGDFTSVFGIDNVMIFSGDPLKYRIDAGSVRIGKEKVIKAVEEIVREELLELTISGRDFLTVNLLKSLPDTAVRAKKEFEEYGILSFILVRFKDINDIPSVLMLSSIDKMVQWNIFHYKHFRTFAKVLSNYELTSEDIMS